MRPSFQGLLYAGGFPNTRSLSLVGASNQEAKITDVNFGAFNRQKFSISLWSKLSTIGTQHQLFTQWGSPAIFSAFTSSGALRFALSSDGATINAGELITTATYTAGVWRRVIFKFDSTLVTRLDRVQIWVDGTRITSFSTATYPALNAFVFDSSSDIEIGGYLNSASYAYDGLIDDLAFFDSYWVSDAEIQTGGKPADLTGLTGLKAWWRFEDNPNDSSGNGHTLTLVNSPTYSTDVP